MADDHEENQDKVGDEGKEGGDIDVVNMPKRKHKKYTALIALRRNLRSKKP